MSGQNLLDHLRRPFSFAVVSDTHFVTHEYAVDLGRETNPLDAEAFVENVTYALAPMMDALRASEPDFIVITGDIAESHGTPERMCADLQAAAVFFGTCDVPVLYARGNLDSPEAFDGVVKPHLAAMLGQAPEAAYYHFDVDGCRFIFLDTTAWESEGAQHRWFTDLLQDAADRHFERVFVLGHHPIWPVARAFFTHHDFSRDLTALMDRYVIDAYFCGHTHNQNIVMHRTENLPVLQCTGAVIGVSDEPPLPLDQVQAMLHKPTEYLAQWPGYLENTAPGWFMVQVEPHLVTASWHHLNRGAEAVISWYHPGDVRSFWTMDQVTPARLIPTDLPRIRRAFLRLSSWHSDAGCEVSLNGDALNPLPLVDGYAPGRIEVPSEALPGLQMENRLRIVPSETCTATLGNLVLEAVLPGGRHVRTAPTGEIFTWSDRWRSWQRDDLIHLKPGQPLSTVLSF